MAGRSLVGSVVAAATLAVLATAASAQLPALQDRPLSGQERVRLAALDAQLVRISASHNTSVAALRTIARAMGTRLTSQDPDQVIRTVEERADELARARGRISALETQLDALDSARLVKAVSPVLAEARQAIDDGRLADAEQLLQVAGDRVGEARKQLQGRADDLAGQEAEILAERAGVRSSLSDFLGAAELWGRAGELAPASDKVARWRYLVAQAQALQSHSDLNGDQAATQRSVDILVSRALPLASREERPADWAQTQFRIGTGQVEVGYRRADPVLVRQGVAAVRASVAATSREAEPAEWMARRIRLGTVLAMLADSAGDEAAIDESLAIFRETVTIKPPGSPALQRAYGAALGLKGLSLKTVGKDKEAATFCAASVAAFRTGLSQLDPKADPRLAGDLYNNLSYALTLLAPIHDGAGDMRAAAEAARAGLAVVERERMPMVWATLQRQYGYALVQLEMLAPAGGGDERTLDEAIAHLRLALEVITPDKGRMLWGGVQQYLAQGLKVRGLRRKDASDLDQAIAAYRASNDAFTSQSAPQAWAENQIEIADLLLAQAARLQGAARLARVQEARAALQSAAPVIATLADPQLSKRLAAAMSRTSAA